MLLLVYTLIALCVYLYKSEEHLLICTFKNSFALLWSGQAVGSFLDKEPLNLYSNFNGNEFLV